MGVLPAVAVVLTLTLLIEVSVAVVYVVLRYITGGKKKDKKPSVKKTPRFVAFVKKHLAGTIISAVVFLVILLYTVLFFIQDLLIFHPNNYFAEAASRLENVTKISLLDGEYSGFLRKSGSKDLMVFYCGNAESAASAICIFCDPEDPVAEVLADYDILVVDYPGYGESSGKPGEKAFYEMADAVIDYTGGLSGYEHKYLVAYSIGTGVATYTASRSDWDKLVLIAPYNNFTDECCSVFPVFFGPLKGLIKHRFPSDEYAKSISEPTCIIVSTDDTLINNKLSEKLKEAFPTTPKYIQLAGLTHGEMCSSKKVFEQIVRFLEE
ncbi:MAG: alpha/beta fold hydrolase [Lachnospiraceae bacterium]|nr:alpha/beta fold hydrolase [Lachnospiraceae bacterium]